MGVGGCRVPLRCPCALAALAVARPFIAGLPLVPALRRFIAGESERHLARGLRLSCNILSHHLEERRAVLFGALVTNKIP